MTAIDKFDLKKNVRFSTYASWWIQQAIKKCLSTKMNESCCYSLDALQEATGPVPADLLSLPSPEEELSDLERFSPQVRAAILQLTPRQRQVILLHFCHGMSLTAIAEHLQVCLQNCCNLQREALNRLRAQLRSP
jgi:RNA polymerase sigma factor (sigma-70 family)